MNSNDILDMIGDANGEYIWDAQRVRSGELPAGQPRLSLRKPLLIAAIVALCLLLVGCTVAYVQGWFGDFFTQQSQQPLSDSQTAYLGKNEQLVNQSQTYNGWTIELRSVISDGSRGYILLRITAPEDVSLERVYKNGVAMSHLEIKNKGNTDELVVPEGVEWDSISYYFQEDDDGLANTVNYVLQLLPDLEACTTDPFTKGTTYRIHIESIIRQTVNEEVWDGVSDIVSFESIWIEETLVEGDWDFSFSFGMKKGEAVEQELVTSPFSTRAYTLKESSIADEYGFYGRYYLIEEVPITSFVLRPLGATISYEQEDDFAQFTWSESDGMQFTQSTIQVVLKDGTEVQLNGYSRGSVYTLEVSAPIVLEEVDHVRMVDGTILYPDGTVELPEWKTARPVDPPEALIPGVTTIEEVTAYYADLVPKSYANYADFDGDGAKDIAVWMDEHYIALCYLTQDGLLREAVPFETPLTIEELCTQYGSDNSDHLERCEQLKPILECYRY